MEQPACVFSETVLSHLFIAKVATARSMLMASAKGPLHLYLPGLILDIYTHFTGLATARQMGEDLLNLKLKVLIEQVFEDQPNKTVINQLVDRYFPTKEVSLKETNPVWRCMLSYHSMYRNIAESIAWNPKVRTYFCENYLHHDNEWSLTKARLLDLVQQITQRLGSSLLGKTEHPAPCGPQTAMVSRSKDPNLINDLSHTLNADSLDSAVGLCNLDPLSLPQPSAKQDAQKPGQEQLLTNCLAVYGLPDQPAAGGGGADDVNHAYVKYNARKSTSCITSSVRLQPKVSSTLSSDTHSKPTTDPVIKSSGGYPGLRQNPPGLESESHIVKSAIVIQSLDGTCVDKTKVALSVCNCSSLSAMLGKNGTTKSSAAGTRPPLGNGMVSANPSKKHTVTSASRGLPFIDSVRIPGSVSVQPSRRVVRSSQNSQLERLYANNRIGPKSIRRCWVRCSMPKEYAYLVKQLRNKMKPKSHRTRRLQSEAMVNSFKVKWPQSPIRCSRFRSGMKTGFQSHGFSLDCQTMSEWVKSTSVPSLDSVPPAPQAQTCIDIQHSFAVDCSDTVQISGNQDLGKLSITSGRLLSIPSTFEKGDPSHTEFMTIPSCSQTELLSDEPTLTRVLSEEAEVLETLQTHAHTKRKATSSQESAPTKRSRE